MRTVKSRPSASILIESLRDIGYSFETALADVIDNSITAGAAVIEIFADFSEGQARIGIVDNGCGMSESELYEAMRPGSRSPLDGRDQSDLGRFGLGLKTASFSQCRKLTVVSRQKGKTNAAIWDIDYVAKVDDWSLQVPDSPGNLPWINELGSSGTVVIWEKLDRVVDQLDSDKAGNQFTDRLDAARRHLELVFHRFLSTEPGHRKVHILLNNRELAPFDPFHSRHPATQMEPSTPEVIRIGDSHVTIQTFTLPHHSKVSASEWEHFGGEGGYIQNQGFYIYRERRLIIWGTWFGLARKTDLTKLARVKVDTPNSLDADWKIDVKKASAQPPHQVRDHLRRMVDRIGKTSKRAYTSRGTKLVTHDRLPVWTRVQNQGGGIEYQINRDHPAFSVFQARLSDDTQALFDQLLELICATLPIDSLFVDVSTNPNRLGWARMSSAALISTLSASVDRLTQGGLDGSTIEKVLKHEEPFKSNWQEVEAILRELAHDKAQSHGN